MYILASLLVIGALLCSIPLYEVRGQGFGWNVSNDTNATMDMMDMDMTGVICPKGYYGPPDCNNTCLDRCGSGNDCDPVNGTCICNSCWSGTDCNIANSSSCFQDYLEAVDKDAILYSEFGNTIPSSDMALLREYFASSLSITDDALIIDFSFEIDERSDTTARPLAKVNMELDYNRDRSGVQRVVEEMRSNVKLGTWRTTLAVQDRPTSSALPSSVMVTMNT